MNPQEKWKNLLMHHINLERNHQPDSPLKLRWTGKARTVVSAAVYAGGQIILADWSANVTALEEGTEKKQIKTSIRRKTMPHRKKVVVTGASGVIAGLMLPALREHYDLTLLDIRTTDRSGNAVEGVQIADLLNHDRDAYRHYFQGADAVVHSGFVSTKDPAQRFFAEHANVEMAYNVYQTAWEERVRRVVSISSNHAADYYERLILRGEWDFVDPDARALSDNYYGWAKEAYEHLGFVFAVGAVNGSPLENVQIRIGGPRETDLEHCRLGDMTCARRALAVYLSRRDFDQLIRKSIEAPDIRDAQGMPFQIFYGISNNARAFWSIANARRIIGYAPEDDSEIRFRDLIAAHTDATNVKRDA